MPRLAAPLDFALLEGRNLVAHQLSGPPTGVKGQVYFDTGNNKLWWFNGTAWVDATGGVAPPDATAAVKGIVQLAGDLAGTAASPQIAAGAVTDVDVNAANKDGVVGTASMRTLGYGAQQAMPGNARLDQIAFPTASVAMGAMRMTGLGDPVVAGDAANKLYVDSVATGLDLKASCRVASTVNVTLAGSAPNTVDGVTLAATDRVLVKNQTTQSQNGVYVVSILGTGANGTWNRATDMDATAEVTPGAFTFVEEGTVNGNTGWVLTTDAPITLGTTALVFTQFSGAGEYTWGAGLAGTGTTVDVGGTANRITVGTDTVDIAATYVGQASITTLGTVTTGVWNGTPVPVVYGGTGGSGSSQARTNLAVPGYYTNSGSHGTFGTTYTITQGLHGLRASRGLIVQVQDATTGVVELPDVAVAANGDVSITFAVAPAANTKIVTIFG